MGVSVQRHTLAVLYPEERSPVPIVQEARWVSEPVWTQRLEEKSFAPTGDQTPVVQSVVRHYTDWATLAPPMARTLTLIPLRRRVNAKFLLWLDNTFPKKNKIRETYENNTCQAVCTVYMLQGVLTFIGGWPVISTSQQQLERSSRTP
jgi:hypothetical protein